MSGLEIPEGLGDTLGGGQSPQGTITINSHSWKSGDAIMRGQSLIGLNYAHRRAAGVEIDDHIEVPTRTRPVPRRCQEARNSSAADQ